MPKSNRLMILCSLISCDSSTGMSSLLEEDMSLGLSSPHRVHRHLKPTTVRWSNCSDTKSGGPGIVQHIHCLLRTLPTLLCLINLSSTNTYSHLDSNRLIARLLICLYFEVRQSIQHIIGHSTAHNVFSHTCIKRFAFHSEGIYILRQHKRVPSKQQIWSFREFLFLFYILYPPAAWT